MKYPYVYTNLQAAQPRAKAVIDGFFFPVVSFRWDASLFMSNYRLPIQSKSGAIIGQL